MLFNMLSKPWKHHEAYLLWCHAATVSYYKVVWAFLCLLGAMHLLYGSGCGCTALHEAMCITRIGPHGHDANDMPSTIPVLLQLVAGLPSFTQAGCNPKL